MLLRRFYPALAVTGFFLLLIMAMGCSESSPVAPANDLTNDIPVRYESVGNHQIWGHYMLTFRDILDENGNPVDFEVESTPIRSGDVHVNVTMFTHPPYCGGHGCMSIQVVNFQPGDPYSTYTVTVFLTNPTAGITGYDVRGIIQPPEGEAELMYADGLTTLFNGGVDTPYPYKAFNADVQFRPFGPRETYGAGYVIRKKNDYALLQMPYVIEASYPGNAGEPVGCYISPLVESDIFHPEGAHALILATITDWQEDTEDLSSVTLTLDPMFGVPQPLEMIKVGENPDNYTSTWQYLVTQGGGYPAGERTLRITATDPVETVKYYYDFTVNVTYDEQGPVWLNDDERGIYDHISGGNFLWLFYYEAVDPSIPFEYIFHGDQAPNATFTEANKLTVVLSPDYTGYKTFGVIAAPDNVEKWYGINLKDAQGIYDDYPDICDYSCTRYSIDARWSILKGQPPGRDGILSGPAIGDVNGDGVDDVVVGTRDYKVYVFGGSGTGTQDTTIWSYATGGDVQSTPALADLNSDGKLDVIFGSDDTNVYAISGASGLPLWDPVDTGDGFLVHASPSIAQLNSGAPDIVIGTGSGEMLALNGEDGSEIWSYMAGAGIAGTAAVADVTGEGVPDVCFGAYDTKVHMVNGQTGEAVWEPYYVGPGMNNVECPPVMVDINNDSVPDVIIGARDNVGPGGVVIALNGMNGNTLWMQGEIWGNPKKGPAPIRDINGDGIWDFLVCTYYTENYSMYALSGANGDIIYQVTPPPPIDPTTPFNYSAPVVGDFTGDGHVNAIYGRQDGFCDIVNAGDLDYPAVEEWRVLFSPQVSSGSKPEIYGTPAVGDVDNDGEWELIAANMRGYVYILDMHAPVPEDITLRGWTQHGGNRWHTGTPEFEPPD
jgi:hypothetical protein